MSSGWYKQRRNITESPWFKDADVLLLYTYLKATAYVTDGMYKGLIIRRGSCPTTRPDMMEATGLTYKKVDRCLRCLIANNEILVKGYYKFSIITICDYDACGQSENLFDDEEVRQRYDKGTTPPIYIKEDKNINNNLISPYSPYKNERENKDVALEVKKRYNKEFAGMLPPCIRLSTSTRIAVEECLRRFGLQSVDMVFAQIKTEKFHLGDNNTGFIANFTFIFTPKNYQQYIERAQLARQKKEAQQTKVVAPAVQEEPQLTKAEKDAKRDADRRDTLVSLVETIKTIDHKPVWYDILLSAYESGELAGYGIDWKPNNND